MKAGMHLRTLVRVLGLLQALRVGVDVIMPLRRPRKPISEMQARVKPLGGVGGSHLACQHVTEFVIKGLGNLPTSRSSRASPPSEPNIRPER